MAIGVPEYQVAPLPGSGGQYGSGCSPGSNNLPDGIWFGQIMAADGSAIEFDLMCFGRGPEGPGDVSNTSPKLRTVSVDHEAIVYRVADDGTGWDVVPYSAWLTMPASPFCADACVQWLYVNDGAVTGIVELWFA